jgi:bla regulator protein BlaR1
MEALLIEFAVRAVLIAAVVAAVLWIMRVKTASARHAVWAGVVLVMLLLPAFLNWGPKASLPLLPREVRETAVGIPPVVTSGPYTPAVQVPKAKPAPREAFVWSWKAFFAGVYLLGLALLLCRLAFGTVRVRSLLRGAVMRDGRLTHVSCATPVTVGWVRPAVILPAAWSDWPQARLDAILAHECEHARRRDPLFQWIALLNRALFWFHPLAWWLERSLSGLAEEACDSAVLARGHDPRDYSETLLDLARSVERAGARVDALGMAMPGAFLPARIRRMLSGPPAPRISRARLMWTAALCSVATAILAAGTLVRAQDKSQSDPVFEVASVKPSAPNAGGEGRAGQKGGGGGLRPQFDHGRFSFTSSLFGLISKAYGIQGCGLVGEKTECALILGGPDWIRKDRFDIQATTPEGTPDYTSVDFFENQAPPLQSMLKALLVDRFHLVVHREERQVPVYALTIGKNGPKLTKAAVAKMIQMPDGITLKDRSLLFTFAKLANGELDPNNMRMIMRDRSMQELANVLSSILDRPMVNRTGLEGKFDVDINYDRDPDGDLLTLSGASSALFRAFEVQLGLKVESTRAPLEVLVIDRTEKPSEN